MEKLQNYYYTQEKQESRETTVLKELNTGSFCCRDLSLVFGWEAFGKLRELSWLESDMWVCALRLMTNGVQSGQSPFKQKLSVTA